MQDICLIVRRVIVTTALNNSSLLAVNDIDVCHGGSFRSWPECSFAIHQKWH